MVTMYLLLLLQNYLRSFAVQVHLHLCFNQERLSFHNYAYSLEEACFRGWGAVRQAGVPF